MSFEYLTAIRDIIVSVAAIITSTVAILGLKKWKQELRGKTEFEVARKLLKLTYKLRDELACLRYLHINAPKRPSSDEKIVRVSREEASKIYDEIYDEKLKSLRNIADELTLESIEAEILWKNNPLTDNIEKLINSIPNDTERYERALKKSAATFLGGEDAKKLFPDLFQPKEGKINLEESEINDVIENIEKLVYSHLEHYLKRN